VSHDVVFEEGEPHRTSPSVEENIPLFDTAIGTLDNKHNSQPTDQQNIMAVSKTNNGSDDQRVDINTEPNRQMEPIRQMEPTQQPIHRSSCITQPSTRILQSREYQQHEEMG